MKVQILTPTIADIKYLKVQINMPYYEDFEVNGKSIESWDELPPCMRGHINEMEFAVDIENGNILGWEEGMTFTSYAKIVDNGTYHLTDEDYQIVLPSLHRYVPNILDTKGYGFGDYMQFSVDEKGYIIDYNLNLNDFPVTLLN